MSKRPHIRAVEGEVPSTAPKADSGESALELTHTVEEDTNAQDWAEDWDADSAPRRLPNWLGPALPIAVILGWTGLFVWANRAEFLGGATAQQVIGWITSWSIPVLLVLALWMLVMRSSTREAARFADAAQLLSAESAQLEQRLATVNRELSLAREFLTTQTRELEFLGRSAADRLSEHAGQLQSLVQSNGAQVEAIATVSTNALENMNRLRDNLPVIANSTRDVANQIGGAGRTAQGQLAELINGFERLNAFGSASERQVTSLRKRIDEALEEFGLQTNQLQELANQRFAALREESEQFRNELDGREIESLASIRSRAEALRLELAEGHAATRMEEETIVASIRDRIDALRDDTAQIAQSLREGEHGALSAWNSQIDAMRERLQTAVNEISAIDEKALQSARQKLLALQHEAEAVDARLGERDRLFHDEITARRLQFADAEDNAIAQLQGKLASLDAAIAQRQEAQLAQMAMMEQQGAALAERIAELGSRFTIASQQGEQAQGSLAQGIEALNAKLLEGREALDGTDMAVAALTDASVRLLELIQASAKHSRDDLPVAMAASETRLDLIEQRAGVVRDLLNEARISGEAVVAGMQGADQRSREAMEAIDAFALRFGDTATAQVDSVERLRSGVAALSEDSAVLAARVQGELREAIAALQSSSLDALKSIESEQSERIERIAGSVGQKSAAAIARALAEHSSEAIAKLNLATQASSETARDAARHLRDQLAKVNELTTNLEARVSRARERAEEQVDNDFSRRVALITESLNSNAIDIARVLSTEITDTAWNSYLRGDRGIFTRRAVRLLDNGEAREIAELYDADTDFREHVNRYIHDFESMLRVMLSTRDGNAVSVTLLSSDMGKLYVALAQAIERLRQ